MYGDWNLDNKLDIEDLSLYRSYLANQNPKTKINNEDKGYADFTADHKTCLNVNRDNYGVNLPDLVLIRIALAQTDN